METDDNDTRIRKTRTTITLKDLEIIYAMRLDGDSFVKIARNLNLSPITVKNRFYEIERCKTEGINLSILIKKKGRAGINDSNILLQLQRIIQDDPLLTQSGMKKKLHEINIQASQPKISRKLKDVEITRKRVKKVYEKVTDLRIINERKAFALKYRNTPNSKLLYLDETGINLHTMMNYGYSPKNTPVNVLVRPRGRNVSCMVLISNERILKYKLLDRAYSTSSFKDFMNDCVEEGIDFKNRIVLMDNVRFHKTALIREFLDSKNIAFDFIPPYSPALNPIEESLSVFKAKYFNKRPLAQTNSDIKQFAAEVFSKMNEDISLDMNAFYVHMREFMDLAYTGAFF